MKMVLIRFSNKRPLMTWIRAIPVNDGGRSLCRMGLWERERILGKKCGQLRRNGW